jgi:hypothetical protein
MTQSLPATLVLLGGRVTSTTGSRMGENLGFSKFIFGDSWGWVRERGL